MKKIVIIEDNENTALALVIRLKAHGFATVVASDAISGLATAVRERPDLVILDIAIPAGDGFALAAKLRTLAHTKDLPIIFLTASKDPELRQKVMDLKAAGLLEKPYQTEELLLMINYAFERLGRTRPAVSSIPPKVSENQRAAQKKILLVEDDRNIAKSLRIRLEAAGYDALLAEDGLAAVNAAVKNRPDLVLLDISMPAGNGFTVAQRIQTTIQAPTPIIFLTASKRPEFRRKAEELGAIGFFEKPFEADELLETIKHALANRPADIPGPRLAAQSI